MRPNDTDVTLTALAVGSDRRLPRWSTPDLDAYCLSAPREDREFIRAQQMDAHAKNSITCRCGFRRWIGFAFRCFYCGEWMCMACAEAHFGKTLHQWREEKRVQLRQEIESRRHQV